ncbi:hypothetical protein ACFYTU_20765 [Nonomuraea angiospora]|uniref:SbtR family transcriptional regulator n=1 Tax=Nonomuraea angiospora TaxID=46172 RepID=UPI0036A40437
MVDHAGIDERQPLVDPPGPGQSLSAAGAPAQALHEWLRLFMDHIASKRDLALAVTGDSGATALVAQWHASMLDTASGLLDAARRAGDVRADLDVRDLLTLVRGIALATADRTQAGRLLRLIDR